MKGMLDLFDLSSDETRTAIPKATFRRESVFDIDGELEFGKIEFGTESGKPQATKTNFDNIHEGQTETLYTRAIASERHPSRRPDPEDLFDMLLARRGQPIPHPTKISSLLLGLAGIIVHDLFRTGENDNQVIAGLPYLALSPLYGRSQETQDSVRTKIDGKLKSDAFAEVDIVNQPPQVGPALGTVRLFADEAIDRR